MGRLRAVAGWVRAQRLLVAVYGIALVLASFELTTPGVVAGEADDPSWFLDPDVNIADVSAALYPDRASTLYYRAFQASLCASRPADDRSACREHGPVRPGEVHRLLARSLATGNRSIELAMYNYALVLLEEGAPRKESEAALRRWRAAYPHSTRPDPRVLVAEMRRGRTHARRRASR